MIFLQNIQIFFLVGKVGLEPTRLTALVPKTNVYYQFHHIPIILCTPKGIRTLKTLGFEPSDFTSLPTGAFLSREKGIRTLTPYGTTTSR